MNNPSTLPIASRRSAFAIVIGLTLFSGAVHGYLDGRWSQDSDLKQRGSRLNDLPQSCGDWVLVESSELPEDAAEMLRCFGSVVREYRNQKYGYAVNVAVLFGPRGPIAVHTPEVCYDSVGTKQTRDRQSESVVVKDRRHQLWSVQFSRKPDPDPVLEVWYAWSDGGNWQASKYPRFWLTENLYKIQLAGPVVNGTQIPCRDFLKEFLPHVQKVIQ